MIIHELVFQGIFGCHAPERLTFDPGMSAPALPEGLRLAQLQDLITSLLYPRWLPSAITSQFERGDGVKVAIVFEHKERRYRLLRRESLDTLRLQVREGEAWRELAAGAKIEPLLIEKLRLPSYPVYHTLNLWRFDLPLPAEPAALNWSALSEQARDIIHRYRSALDYETLDDEIKSLEERVATTRRGLGDGAKLEDKLKQAHEKLSALEIRELPPEDLALLQERDRRLQELDELVSRITMEEEQARAQVDATLPERPWRQPLFWGGVAIALGAIGLSVAMHDGLRLIVLLDVIGLSICAWILLRYFNDMERASVHLIRLDSIKRRLNQVREEQVTFQDRIKHILIHAGVRDEDELVERVEKSARLREIIEKMESQRDKLAARPEYRQAVKQLQELDAQLEEARQRQRVMTVNTVSSYQLEDDLKRLGIDPKDARQEIPEGDLQDPASYNATALTRLAEAARQTEQLSAGVLSPRTQKMWAKICAHVLGARFDELGLSQGRLVIKGLTAEQVEIWLSTRASEGRLVAAALAVALQVNCPERASSLDTIIVGDPEELFVREHAQRFGEVFRSAAQRSQIILSAP